MHAACGLVILYPPSVGLVALALGSYALRMWAITAGYHRFFAHRSYSTSRPFRLVLAILGTSAMQNGPIWWASWHRLHHKHSDTPRDPHSPRLLGIWRSHVGWFLDGSHDTPDLSNVVDLTYLSLRVLSWLGLVWDLRVPPVDAVSEPARLPGRPRRAIDYEPNAEATL